MEKRRERAKEEMIEKIIGATIEIVSEEGFEGISIRKIANKIEYSPSIIYHYFKDKDEIFNEVMKRGYGKILKAIGSVNYLSDSAEDRLKNMTRNYIEAALNMPEEFMAAQLNQSEQALKHTASLFKGAAKEKQALSVLYENIKELNKNQDIDDSELELVSQIIVVSIFGLIIKLIIEKNIGEEQRIKLVNYFINEELIKLAYIRK